MCHGVSLLHLSGPAQEPEPLAFELLHTHLCNVCAGSRHGAHARSAHVREPRDTLHPAPLWCLWNRAYATPGTNGRPIRDRPNRDRPKGQGPRASRACAAWDRVPCPHPAEPEVRGLKGTFEIDPEPPSAADIRKIRSDRLHYSDEHRLGELIPLPELIESAVAVSWCRIFE